MAEIKVYVTFEVPDSHMESSFGDGNVYDFISEEICEIIDDLDGKLLDIEIK